MECCPGGDGVEAAHIHPGMDGAVVVESLEDPLPPEPPRDVEATAGPESATVAWLSPEFDGGSPVTDYVVTTVPGGQWDIFGSVDCASSLEVVTGFADGTYGPGAGVRRDQMATFVVRLLDLLQEDTVG